MVPLRRKFRAGFRFGMHQLCTMSWLRKEGLLSYIAKACTNWPVHIRASIAGYTVCLEPDARRRPVGCSVARGAAHRGVGINPGCICKPSCPPSPPGLMPQTHPAAISPHCPHHPGVLRFLVVVQLPRSAAAAPARVALPVPPHVNITCNFDVLGLVQNAPVFFNVPCDLTCLV